MSYIDAVKQSNESAGNGTGNGNGKKVTSETPKSSYLNSVANATVQRGASEIQLGSYGVGDSQYDTNITPESVVSLEQIRGEKQGWASELTNAVLGGVAKMPFTVIGNVASIVDFEDYFNTDNEVGNSVTAWAEEMKGNIEDATKIYKSNDNTLSSREWWMNNGKGLIDSAGGFVLTGGALGKGLQVLSELTKGSQIVRGVGTVANAAMLNQAESIPTAMNLYKDSYESNMKKFSTLVDNGAMTPEDADLKARESASDVASYSIAINRINIPLNLTSSAAFLRTPAMTRQIVKQASKKDIIEEVFKEGAQEYVEENVNMISENEAKRKSKQGNDYAYNFSNTLNDVFSKEGFETGLVGFVGGAVQTGGTELLGSFQKDAPSYDENGNVRYDENNKPVLVSRSQSKNERFNAQKISLNKIEALGKVEGLPTVKETLSKIKVTGQLLNDIQTAAVENDDNKVGALQNELLTNQALESFKNGTAGKLIEQYNSISRDPNAKEKYGEDVFVKTAEAIKQIEDLEKIYIKNQSSPFVNDLFQNRSRFYYNVKQVENLSTQITKAKIEQDRELKATGFNSPELIASLETTKELNSLNEKLTALRINTIKLNFEYNDIQSGKVKPSKTEDEVFKAPVTEETIQKSNEEALAFKNEVLEKINNSQDHNEIQQFADELNNNASVSKEDVDFITEKYNQVKESSIRRNQVTNQLETAKAHRDDTLGKLFSLNTSIDEKSNDINEMISSLYDKDFDGNLKPKEELKTGRERAKIQKLIDETRADIVTLKNQIKNLEDQLVLNDEEVERITTKLQANESIESVKTELEHKNKERVYIEKQISSTKENISALESLLRKLNKIFKSLFPNYVALAEKGKYDVVEAQEELLSKKEAIKELKSTLKDFNDIRNSILKDMEVLNAEIDEFNNEMNSSILSIDISDPIVSDNGVEVTNESSKKEGEFDRAKKDVTYGLTSTAGNNMLYLGNGKWSDDVFTNDPAQLRWFEHTSMMQVNSRTDNQLMAITMANNPFGDKVKFYDENTILMVLHTNGKLVLVNGELVYTSMRLPMSIEQTKSQFTNKQNLTDPEINVLLDGLNILRDKIKSSKSPLFLKVTGKTKGIAIESNVKNINGKVIYRFPAYGRLTKNNKLDDLNIFVGSGIPMTVGTQTFDTTAGMVYSTYDGQVVPMKVAKLSEIDGATDKALELIKKLMEINSPGYAGKELYIDVYKQLNLLILFGNVNDSKFKIFVSKDGRLNYNNKYHKTINENELREFLDNKYIRVDKELLKSNKTVKNPITGVKSSYKYYLLNNKGKADDQVLVGTSLQNQDKQQFKSVGLKFDVLASPSIKTPTTSETKSQPVKVQVKTTQPVVKVSKSKEELEAEEALERALGGGQIVLNEDPKVASLLNPIEVKTETETTTSPLTTTDAKAEIEIKKDELEQEKDQRLNELFDSIGLAYTQKNLDIIAERNDKKAIEFIEKYDEVNAKYDAELAALEGGKTSGTKFEKVSKKDVINNTPTLDSGFIPESVAKKAFDKYFQMHKGQTFGEINGRGGFGTSELDNLYPNWREESVDIRKSETTSSKQSESVAAETRAEQEDKSEPLNKDDEEDFLRRLQQAKDDDSVNDWDRTFLPSEEPATEAELLNEEKWFKENFPQIDYVKIKGLLSNNAIGRLTSEGKVLISDLAARGTTYHEAWHVVSQLLLTEDELSALYKDYRSRTGFKGTNREVEELIAEDFRNYMLGEKTTFSPKTRSIFQKIVDFFKGLFSLNNKDLDAVFSNIKKGKYKSSKVIRNPKEDFNRTLPGKSVEFTKDLLDSVNVFFFKNLLDINDSNSIDNLFDMSNVSDLYEKVLDNFMNTYKKLPEDAKERLKENYVYINKNWKTIVNEHVKSLTKFGVNIELKDSEKEYGGDKSVDNDKLSDNSNYEEKTPELEKTTRDNTYIDSITFSSKDGMPKSIKLLIASLPKGRVVDGKFKVDINARFATPKSNDYNNTLNFLFNKLAGAQSLKEMVARMSNSLEMKPELIVLMKYLKSNPSSTTPVTLNDNQFTLQMQFFQQFAKTNNKYLTTLIDDEGNVFSFDSNSSRIGERIKTNWKNKQKNSINKGDGFYSLTDDGIILINKARVNAIANAYPLSNIKNSLMFLSKFGIDFSTENFNEKEQEVIITAANKILDYAVNKDAGDIFQKNVVGESISNLTNIEANYNKNEIELQHINPEGKTVYGITLNTYLSLMVNDINNTYALNHMDGDNNVYAKNSLWKKHVENGGKIELSVAEGLSSNQPGEKGKVTSDLDMGSYILQSINLVLNNRFPFLRAGDKKLEYLFEVPMDINKEDFIDQMILYYKDDIMRSLELKKGAGSNIQYYKDQASRSLIFEEITSLYPNLSKIKTKEGVDKFIKDNRQKLSDSIQEFLGNQSNIFKSNALKYGIINSNKEGSVFNSVGIDSSLLSSIVGKTKDLNANEFNRIAEQFTIKSLIGNIEQIKIFTGDLAFYNLEKGDFNKRTGGLTGPKKVANTDPETNEWLNENKPRKDGKIANGKVNTVIYKDVESTSEYFDEYTKAIGIDKASEAYKNMKEADAQGYITLDEYREFFYRSGEWTKKHELAYNRLINGETLSKDDFQYFMPIKPQYFGPQTNDNGLYVPTYYKFSLMPLIPSMVKGRQIEKLSDMMSKKENQIGIAMFASANRVGANMVDGNLVPFYNEKGEINENTNIQEIDYKYLGIQLDIAPAEKRKVTFGTQVRKLIMSNLFSNGIAKTISVLRDGKLTETNGNEIKKDYDDTINKLTQIKRAKLKERLKLSPRADGTFGISDIEVFKNVILQEAESRDIADNILKSIEYALDSDDKFLDATISKNKIEQILYSLVNNNVISQKMFGDMKVMGSSAGFELEARKFKTLTEKDKSKIEWISNTQTLKFYHKLDDGSTSKMQVLLPSWFKEIQGDVKQFDSRLLELMGYRIPTDGLGAIDSIEVVGFLPKETGNLIITPSEIVGKAGSDYDVDKLNIFFPNYIMVSGKPQYIPTNKADQKKLYEFIKESDNKYKKSFEQFLSDNEEAILQNNVLKISKEILSSPDMFNQLISPTVTSTLKAEVEKLRKKSGKTEKKITGTSIIEFIKNAQTAISFWSGKAGVGIAALHNTSHILSQQAGLFVSSKAKTNMTLSHNITKDENGMPIGDIDLSSEFDSTHEIDPKTKKVIKQGLRISDIIKEFVNAYVDIARDPFIFDLNAGLQTSNTWLYLVRAGVPVNTIAEFMKQPIIFDYVLRQSINDSVLMKTTGKGLGKDKMILQLRNDYKLKNFKKDEEFKFKEKDLGKYLSESYEKDDKFYFAQQAILTEFLEHQRMSRELSKMMQATSVDTKGAGKNRNSARNIIEVLNEVKESDIFGNFNKYTEDSILKEFIQTVKESGSYYNELFVTDKENFRTEALDKLKNNFNYEGIPFDKLNDLMDLAENELITYIIHTAGENALTNKIDELFTGPNSLAFRIIEAKKDPKLSQNLLIQNLFPRVSNNRKNIDNVSMFSKKLNVYESNQLTEAYTELYNLNQGLADDLTKLAILQSGMSNSPISFTSIIPADKFFEIASKAIDAATVSENFNLYNFIDLFYQNNYNNSDVVKKLPNFKLNNSAFISENKLIFDKADAFYSDRPYLKTVTVKSGLSSKEKNEMQSRGENIFDVRLYKKMPGGLEFIEVPIKGNGMYLKDYRKTDNVVKREPALSVNKGEGNVGETFSSAMSVEDAFDMLFGGVKKTTAQPKAATTQPSTNLLGPETKINIYSGTGENAELSNFAIRPFVTNATKAILGESAIIKFNTVEGAFQAAKVLYANNLSKEDNNFNKSIVGKLQTATGAEAKRLGQQIKGLNSIEWDKASSNVMKDLISASFEQNPDALNNLLATGNATLTHTQDKTRWGKKFPKLLMEVRAELKPTQSSTSVKESTEKLEVTGKKIILSEDDLVSLNIGVQMAGYSSMYTMEKFNALSEENKKKLIECYL